MEVCYELLRTAASFFTRLQGEMKQPPNATTFTRQAAATRRPSYAISTSSRSKVRSLPARGWLASSVISDSEISTTRTTAVRSFSRR